VKVYRCPPYPRLKRLRLLQTVVSIQDVEVFGAMNAVALARRCPFLQATERLLSMPIYRTVNLHA